MDEEFELTAALALADDTQQNHTNTDQTKPSPKLAFIDTPIQSITDVSSSSSDPADLVTPVKASIAVDPSNEMTSDGPTFLTAEQAVEKQESTSDPPQRSFEHRIEMATLNQRPAPQPIVTNIVVPSTSTSAPNHPPPSNLPTSPSSAGEGGVRSVFELTELDMLRLRPFIHGVHVRVHKKRTKYIFGPESMFRRFWCALRAVFTIYFMIMIPLRACFTLDTDKFPATLPVDYFIDFFFLLDFLAWNLVFSAYDYSQGVENQIIYRPKEISRHYRKWHGYWYDVIATFPIDYVFIPLRMWKVILWLRLLKLIRMRNLLACIESIHPQYIRNQIDPVVKRMIVVFCSIYMCIHWAACGWNLLRNGLASEKVDLSYMELAHQYVASMYFIQTAVVTLGYGDIVPETTREVIFVTVIMIFGFVAQAALVGHLITLLKHRLGKRAWYRSSLLQLKQFCMIHDLSPAVTRRLFHYYHYLWARQKGLDEQQLLMNDFPPIYMQEFGVEVTLDIFATIPFMCQDGITPPAGFIRALVPYLYPETFCPNITILQQGVCNTKLYLIVHGTVEQILDDLDADVDLDGQTPPVSASVTTCMDHASNELGFTSSLADKPLPRSLKSKHLSHGSFFGHDSFLVPMNSLPYTYLSTSYVDLFSIDSQHFRFCLSSYPDFEAKVTQYVEVFYSRNEKMKPSERVITLNSNLSARLRRIRREAHINKLKRVFAKRQKTRILNKNAGLEPNSPVSSSKRAPGRSRSNANSSDSNVDVSVIKPHSILHIILQSLSFVGFVYFMISLPLRIGFSNTWESGEEFVGDLLVDYLIDIWFWMEMILRMWKIALIDELNPQDPLLTDARLILYTYIHSYSFVLDLLSLIPFDLIALFVSYHQSGYTEIALSYVCLVRLRVFFRFHRFFQYFQSFTFALTLLFDQAGLVELNAQTGGFGGAGAHSEANQSIAMGGAQDLLQLDDNSSDEASEGSEEELEESAVDSGSGSKPKLKRRQSTATGEQRSATARCLHRLNTPHAILSHSYHTRTALLVFRLLLVIGFFIHLSSCFFFYVARIENVPDYAINPDGSSNNSPPAVHASDSSACAGALCGKSVQYSDEQSYNWAWRSHIWFNMAQSSVQYLHSLLWALETCTVIGMGEIVPINMSEYLYTFVFTFIGSTLYLVMLGFLTVLVDAAFQNAHSFEQSINCADHFIQKQALPTTLRLRVHTYYHFLWFVQSGKRDENFLENLPSHLRLDVVSFLALPIVTSIPLFSNIELGALERILLALTPVSAGPMDVLLMQGEVSNRVVLIQKGSVDVSINAGEVDEDLETTGVATDANGITLPVLRSGNYFNDRCLLLLGPSPANYVALSFCHLFTLSKRSFDQAIANYAHFKALVRDRRERAKQHEKEKVERMRRKVERMEKERASKIIVVESARPAQTKSGVPPPPPSPPATPAPTSTSTSGELPGEITPTPVAGQNSSPAPSGHPRHLSLTLPSAEEEDRNLIRALKKKKQQEKMEMLREEKKRHDRPHRGSLRRSAGSASMSFGSGTQLMQQLPLSPARPTAPTSDTPDNSGPLSPSGNAAAPHRRSRSRRDSMPAILQQLADSSSSSEDSDTEETRLRLLDLRRRNTNLTRVGTSNLNTTSGSGTGDSSPVHSIRGQGQGFRDLERNITRRLNKNSTSIKNFLNAAEREANEEAFQGETAEQQAEEEDMNRRLIEMADSAVIDMPPAATGSDAVADAATGPTKGGKGLTSVWSSASSTSFAVQSVKRTQTEYAAESVVSKSLAARLFYHIFCCSTPLFNLCFTSCCIRSKSILRVYSPTSIFRVLWNVVSMCIVFYYLLIIPFRVCIGLFPTDSVLGERGMDALGRTSHIIPANVTLTGDEATFDGLILWHGNQAAIDAVKYGLWCLDLLITLFWFGDIILRCKYFPLFVHHSDGSSMMKKASPGNTAQTVGAPITGNSSDARAIQNALHNASGVSSPAGAMKMANTVLLAKKMFLNNKKVNNNLLSAAHPLQRTHTMEKHHPASAMLHVKEKPTLEIMSDAPRATATSSAVAAAIAKKSAASAPPTRSGTMRPNTATVLTETTTIYDAYWASGHLKWDLLGTIPFDLVFGLWYPQIASVLRLARLARVHRIFQYIQGFENFIEFYAVRINTVVLRIVEQFLILVFTIHIFGCAWFLIGRIEFVYYGIASTAGNAPIFSAALNRTVINPLQVNTPSNFDNTHGWLSEEAFTPVYGNDRTMRNVYINSIYFILTTISTVGFGDIVPHTTLENLFVAVLIIFGCVIYSFVTANIASLAANLDVSAEAFGEKVDYIKRFMNSRKLPLPLQKKIYNYYREQWNQSKGYEEENLLEEIPYYLRQALVYTLHEGLLHNHVLFRGLEENFLIHLSMALRYVLVIAGQIILHKGEVSLDMFLIQKGSVHIMMDDGAVLDEVSEGGSFNEGALFHMEEIMKHEESKRRKAGKDSRRSTAKKSLSALMEVEEENSVSTAPSGTSAAFDRRTMTPSGSSRPGAFFARLPPTENVAKKTSARPTPPLIPTIRQLYTVVAVSHSVDLYTLHQKTVEEMCKLYPASSLELKKRWREKTTVKQDEDIQQSVTVPEMAGPSNGTGAPPSASRTATMTTLPHGVQVTELETGSSDSFSDDDEEEAENNTTKSLATLLAEASNDAPQELPLPTDEETLPSPMPIVGGAPRFPSEYESPRPVQPAELNLSPTHTVNLHVHQHSHAIYDGIQAVLALSPTSAHGDPMLLNIRAKHRKKRSSQSRFTLMHMNTFTTGATGARFLNHQLPNSGTGSIVRTTDQPQCDPYNQNYDDESVQKARLKLTSAIFNSGFIWRDGSVERLRWNLFSLFCLLVHLWVIPLFIAFTQIHILDTTTNLSHLESDNTVFWVFIGIACTADFFFIIDWILTVRHFAVERQLEGVHWRHYLSRSYFLRKLKEMEEMKKDIENGVRRNLSFRFPPALANLPITTKQNAPSSNKVADIGFGGILPSDNMANSDTETSSDRAQRSLSVVNSDKRLVSAENSTSEDAPRPTAPHLNPDAFTTLSTLPFHVEAFPTTSSEVMYAYFHQPYAMVKVTFDVLAIFPMAAIALIVMVGMGGSYNFTLLSLLSLNRLLSMFRMSYYMLSLDSFLDRMENLHVSFQTRRIFKYGLLILFIIHWVSCCWLLFGATSSTPAQLEADLDSGRQSRSAITWMMLMKEGRVQTLSEWHQYLFSVYWSISVVTTTGFGDVTPVNPGEVLFCMAVILVGNLIYGCIIGAVTTSTANHSAQIAEHFEQLNTLTHYMKHRHVSAELQEKTLLYHKHLWRTYAGLNDAAVIKKLPLLLRKEVCYTLYGSYLAQVPFFPTQDVSFLANLSILLHPQLYLAGDLLMRKEDIGNEMYFLRSGRVRVFIYDSDENGGSLRKKITLAARIWLGEHAFFERSLRSASIRALTHCDVLVLANQDFQMLLMSYPHYRYTIYESFLQHAEKNYTDVKKPVANASFVDFQAILDGERSKEAAKAAAANAPIASPSAAVPASSPVPEPSIARDAAGLVVPSSVPGSSKKVYKISIGRPRAAVAAEDSSSSSVVATPMSPQPLASPSLTTPGSPAVMTPSRGSSSVLPPASPVPSSPAAANRTDSPGGPLSSAQAVAAANPSNISFANLVKLIAASGPSSSGPANVIQPDRRGMNNLKKSQLSRMDTFSRMMNS